MPQFLQVILICLLMMPLILGEELKDDSKIDLEAIKKLLLQLEQKQKEALEGDFGSFVQDLSAAVDSGESAVKLYQSCVRKVDFEGKALDSNEWNEWKTNNAEMLGDKNFKKGLLFQLQFFQLWIKAYQKTEITELEDSLVALCFEIENYKLLSASEKVEKKEGKKSGDNFKKAISTALSGSYFAKAYRLELLLKETKGWDINLSNSEQILEKLLMSHYRGLKNARLFNLWEKRIEWFDLKTKYDSMSNEQKFTHENELLSLRWTQAQDLKLFGFQNKAVNLMFSIISKAPDHPQFEGWIKELRGVLGIKSE